MSKQRIAAGCKEDFLVFTRSKREEGRGVFTMRGSWLERGTLTLLGWGSRCEVIFIGAGLGPPGIFWSPCSLVPPMVQSMAPSRIFRYPGRPATSCTPVTSCTPKCLNLTFHLLDPVSGRLKCPLPSRPHPHCRLTPWAAGPQNNQALTKTGTHR